MNNKVGGWLLAFLIIIIVVVASALWFGINWILTKGVIWVAIELFKIDWTEKFWAVFIGLAIIQSLIGCARSSK